MNFKAIWFILFVLIWQPAGSMVLQDTIPPSIDTLQLVETDEPISLFEKFIRDSIFEISIATNFDSLEVYKIIETYQPTLFTFTNPDSTETQMKMKVRTRGKMRKRVCNYVSLKLKFKKAHLEEMGLSEENKYKLVCQCDGGKNSEQLLLREYMGYRFYNILTEDSYQTHLFKVNYIDTSDGTRETRYAFLLEDEDAFAKRREGKALERKDFLEDNLSRTRLVQMSIFQYMLGNTDWSVSFLHNVKIVSAPNGKMIIPVPYDFDYSGLVNAPYAIPNPDLKLNLVTDRHFMASGCSENEINAHLEEFRRNKAAIMNEWQSFDLFNKASRKHIDRFLSKFFGTIENPKKIRRAFVR